MFDAEIHDHSRYEPVCVHGITLGGYCGLCLTDSAIIDEEYAIEDFPPERWDPRDLEQHGFHGDVV